MPAILGLLCLEAMAISSMYLSELWKYIRVGAYIREELQLPTGWERWIERHRAYELYVGSLTLLQLPVLVTVAAGALSVVGTKVAPESGSLLEWAGWLTRDGWMTALLSTVLLLDIAVVGWLVWRVTLATRGQFGWPDLTFRHRTSLDRKDGSVISGKSDQ